MATMRVWVLPGTLLLLAVPMTGCVAMDEAVTDDPVTDESQKQWIEDEEEFIDLVEEGSCGD